MVDVPTIDNGLIYLPVGYNLRRYVCWTGFDVDGIHYRNNGAHHQNRPMVDIADNEPCLARLRYDSPPDDDELDRYVHHNILPSHPRTGR